MSKLQVLIVDDEWNMRNLLRIYLMKEGFRIQEAATGQEALSMIKKNTFDIILLDVMMPDMDGWQVCRAVRETDTVPILMLTARTETKDKIHGLGVGADDYLTKPFEPEELLARMYSLIRRSTITQVLQPPQWVLDFPELNIFPDAREIRIHEVPVDFTQKEFDLLMMLAQSKQRAFTREELVERVWGHDYEGEIRVVDTHIKNIREKLHRAGMSYNPIQTLWGVGYKFQAAENQDAK
ncbi:DNA-binding response regulator [Paenibacillus sp. VTT E-133280]|uniref:response regulator transcription factor n=1 Tax=unclassified Paenibacillus TaxID=185978 RepID=UPI000BA01329|nr:MULTISPECIES: response regulator transcription factor [unclassified Paenibacillus]MBY3621384.1 response regulator transcription factor [Acinetobacter sp. CUI P1]MDH6373005.1 two-component system response regulator ResD [Paenibacillus sp. PastF-3]OZQ60341.1 DNA-binding response regulator [Paenibacillus sp. VTT E-133280]OZQ85090.1 DNA-binding response regulator [Paenibacillus sp. VTT E-133291]